MRWTVAALLCCLMVNHARAQAPKAPSPLAQSSSDPQTAELIQPADLAAMLRSSSPKPVILHVGFRSFYHGGHIPGADFIGPVSQPSGKELLEKRVRSLSPKTLIIVYCGCCPWDHCPNITPALTELRKMGFTNIKALYLAENFRVDWTDKGYPVEKD